MCNMNVNRSHVKVPGHRVPLDRDGFASCLETPGRNFSQKLSHPFQAESLKRVATSDEGLASSEACADESKFASCHCTQAGVELSIEETSEIFQLLDIRL